MATLLPHQTPSYHLPRILGWDVAGVLAPRVTADYRRLVNIFALEPPGVPFTLYVEPGVGHTAHCYGNTTTFFVGAEDPYGVSVTAAMMVDVFIAAVGTGWEERATNGTALVHALAAALHPELVPLLHRLTRGWWRHGATDYLSTNGADAGDPDATGCGWLFLSYLHDGLGQSWPTIVRTGGPALAVTYAALTGADVGYAYPTFMQSLTPWVDHAGELVLPAHGSPWRARRPVQLRSAGPWGAEVCSRDGTRHGQRLCPESWTRRVWPSHSRRYV